MSGVRSPGGAERKEKPGDRFSRKRLGSLAVVTAATLVLGAVTAIRCGYDLDGAFSLLFISAIFLPLFAFEMEYDRLHGLLADNTQTSLRRVALGYSAGCLLMCGFVFLPPWYRPVILPVIFMSALSNTGIALTSGMFWCCVLSLTGRGEGLEMTMNVMLVLTACVLCVTLKEEKYRFYVSVLFLTICVMMPGVFYYLAHGRLVHTVLIYGGGMGLAAGFVTYLVYNTVYEETRYEVKRSYGKLVDPAYPRVRELYQYSPLEYVHARRVSDISRRCGELIGADAGLCQAAGFYYRMGRWVGEPYVENGVKRAAQLCFPLPLQQILAEFGGEKKDISTRESALIHMVDAAVLKSEVMQAQMGNSSWNRKLLVTQTLNAYSADGLYDRSCMSINEFLRVRELISEILDRDLLKNTEEMA